MSTLHVIEYGTCGHAHAYDTCPGCGAPVNGMWCGYCDRQVIFTDVRVANVVPDVVSATWSSGSSHNWTTDDEGAW